MVEFAGYSMPLQYTGLTDEHIAVRTNVGMFDVSHMGEFMLKGKGALDLIQKVTSNDASKLTPGKIQYSCLPNSKGGIVDDLLVYMMAENEYMLVVNASNIQKDWDWISSHNTFGVEMTNISDNMSLLAVQGPNAVKALQALTSIDLASMVYYTFEKGTFAGCKDVIVSATGYTGAGGFEIYVYNKDVEKVFDAIVTEGKKHGLKLAGLACRDTLRLEMGFCLYGNDIDDTTSPIEAGLGWVTKFTKDFINSSAIKEQKEKGVSKKLIGFEMIDKGIPRHDYKVVDAGGKEIGKVTSGTMAPSLGKAIGLAYVSAENSNLDTEIFVEIRNKQLKAKVVRPPFYKA